MDTVLVVDDNRSQRQMIANLLNRNKFAVWMASNGQDALEQLRDNLPDLIVLDVLMPQMNGFEVCRQLKSNPQTRHIPVVMCSSKTTPVDHYWGMKLGADAYVNKPSYQDQLVRTLKKLRQQKPG